MHLCNTEPKKNVAKVKHITFVSPDAVFTGKNILLMLNIYVYIYKYKYILLLVLHILKKKYKTLSARILN